MSALFADLKAKGLLGETLVVLGTEFGRTPRINDNDGLEQRVRQWDNHSCGPRDKRPAGGPPGQGAAETDAGGAGHRVRSHTSVNDNGGRNYDNGAYTCLVAGGSRDFEGRPRQSAASDQAMSALLANLHTKGLLDQTLVVLGTEFGRTPRINDGWAISTPTTSRGPHRKRQSWTRR